MVKMDLVESSNIASIGYEPEIKKLHVKFKSGGLYTYDNVPFEVYESFLKSESKGRFFQQSIRPVYKSSKISVPINENA